MGEEVLKQRGPRHWNGMLIASPTTRQICSLPGANLTFHSCFVPCRLDFPSTTTLIVCEFFDPFLQLAPSEATHHTLNETKVSEKITKIVQTLYASHLDRQKGRKVRV